MRGFATVVMLAVAIESAAATRFLVAAYLGLLLLHEWGHARAGATAWQIVPVFGDGT